MSTRLQVVVQEAELREIRRVARQERMTVSEWVRRSLRQARRAVSTQDPDRKLEVLRAALEHSAPAPDIEQMLAEIERGYASGPTA
jgi:predicted 2-oxoglutarate/Fe(II)-dependent dioxygenase YbiX